MKTRITLILCSMLMLLPAFEGLAQSKEFDVFIPISKYIQQGDADCLSAWFADNLEISVLASSSNSSRNQARQIMKNFFQKHNTRNFTITHTAGQAKMKYALGNLSAGGENYLVTIFVGYTGKNFLIQQLKIERAQ